MIWSDESKFNLFGSDGRVYVRRRAGEDFLPECIQQTVKFGGGNVMMWGCVSGEVVGPLVRVEWRLNGDSYLHLLSRQLATTSCIGTGSRIHFHGQQCHRARKVRT